MSHLTVDASPLTVEEHLLVESSAGSFLGPQAVYNIACQLIIEAVQTGRILSVFSVDQIKFLELMKTIEQCTDIGERILKGENALLDFTFDVFVPEDLPADIKKQRAEFANIKKILRGTGIRYGMLYPARLIVTIEGEKIIYNNSEAISKEKVCMYGEITVCHCVSVCSSLKSVMSDQSETLELRSENADIPSTRRCGGFVGHGAYRGCHKCLKTFSKKEFGEKMDYSGFERSSWEPHTSKDHTHYAGLSKWARTKAEQKRIERKYGARWSDLFCLSYYDAIRFDIIDPMHNLLLGTARHVFRLWTELGILTTKSLDELQARVENIKVPYEVGRIPLRISSGFTGFTADQWKN
ncbi:hypothetical protein ABVT39_021488 [Epinephelus coioides]